MRSDNWMKEEIDILEDKINKQLDYLETNPDDVDPDTIGAEIENSKKMFEILDTLRLLVNDIQSIDNMEYEVYTLNLFNDLMYGYPISPLHSYEEDPGEWEDTGIGDREPKRNHRYRGLLRRIVRYDTAPDKDEVLYSDCGRFEFFNLIINRKVHIEKGLCDQLYMILDSLLPIEFPYDPKESKVQVYIEQFDCHLQKDGPLVQSLALTHYKLPISGKPERLYQFFDISDGKLNPIDFKAYANRRQIFNKENAEIEEKINGKDDM